MTLILLTGLLNSKQQALYRALSKVINLTKKVGIFWFV